MDTPPSSFDELPEETRQTIEGQTGRITGYYSDRRAAGCVLGAFLDTVRGAVFVKATPTDSVKASSLVQEAAVTMHLPPVCPRLLWRVESGGWLVLGFEVIDGYCADFTNSGDLVYVLDALQELSSMDVPEEDESFWHLAQIEWAEQRWARFADEGTAHLFAGKTLLHTDIGPRSVLIDKRAYVVNWSRPCRGAAFIEPFGMAVRMVEAGHAANEALSWVRRVPSWREATPEARRAFATVTVRMWRERADQEPKAFAMAACAADVKAHLLKNDWT
ncbi:aminoglycoside phosphotransferase [Streptomyces sp. NPDC048420]|uniref:aminoglycoside phosphotransferase n=1 Tax=Streptomyces sp. NPDC048420 TaxID=3155755 RepID=UPI00342D1431